MALANLTETQQTQIANAYSSKVMNQNDLAVAFGTSRTTIRRVLKEKGLVEFSEYATKTDRKLLEVLKTFNISTSEKLSEVLKRGLQC